ncbi:single-stranded DNA-binding protein [Microbacterium sp. p3-SID336]|uniref:single-stranded DNA-binding protein n=1 Tax=Microbacterium sp. p3-SID336 TaxID=2916212 RepID=UPI0021A731B5|nr:single-stranded DNA-binding protein [Microbacterium sp. p3-SID336]MCT1477108.1 single-stranded DNA-binding protein [Microbacterium sp. p3-SID336]
MVETITVVGRVATDPTQGQTGSGVPVTNFRLASTHRRFDTATQTWIDTDTNWFSVAAFRQLGENARASLRVGDGVIVSGRLRVRAWESNGKHGTSVDIEADAIGHDLRWGTTAFRPGPRRTGRGDAWDASDRSDETEAPAVESELSPEDSDWDAPMIEHGFADRDLADAREA